MRKKFFLKAVELGLLPDIFFGAGSPVFGASGRPLDLISLDDMGFDEEDEDDDDEDEDDETLARVLSRLRCDSWRVRIWYPT